MITPFSHEEIEALGQEGCDELGFGPEFVPGA